MPDDGMTATGGLHGITGDTPEEAGTPTGAGSVDGISGAGDTPDTAEESRTTGGTQITLEAETTSSQAQDADQAHPALSREEQEEQREKGLGHSEDGGVTGEHNF